MAQTRVHTLSSICPTIVASSPVTPVAAVTPVNHDMCPVFFKQESAAHYKCAFLGTCPEPPAIPVALPDMIANKSHYAPCNPGSPFKSQEAALHKHHPFTHLGTWALQA